MAMVLIAGAALAGLIFGLIAAALLRIRACQTEALKAEKTELIQRLTAAEVRVSCIPKLERANVDLTTTFEGLRGEKASVDQALAGKVAALEGATASIQDLQHRLEEAGDKLATEKQAVSSLRAEIARITETLTQERRTSDEKLTLLKQAREQMTQEFKSLAEDVMSRHGDSFTKLNKQQIEDILNPLKEKIGDFEQKIQTNYQESIKDRATLAQQIRQIAETGAAMGRETKELTEALRGQSQTQGAWGEMVLNTILERSGLRAGEEYLIQAKLTSDEGQRLRPDVLVNLPGGKQMVVDAKVSLTAFEALVNAATEEERTEYLARHLLSMRGHISTLGSKDYHLAVANTLDYVVMFVPIEGALAVALNADPTLITFAAEKNVAITTPTTLMIALRTVANVWHVERRNQNAEEIARRAGSLYDKFVGFVDDMTAIGNSISRSRDVFNAAMGKLAKGKGNVVRQLEQLKAMGGRTSKSLPQPLLDSSGEGELAEVTGISDQPTTCSPQPQLPPRLVGDQRQRNGQLVAYDGNVPEPVT